MGKFNGVIYWVGEALPGDWTSQAVKRLAPISDQGGKVEETEFGLSVMFPDGGMSVPVVSNQTRGHVPEGTASGALIVCLMALQRHPGGLLLADDKSESLPRRVLKTFPLFCEDWSRVQNLAEGLGLLAGREYTMQLNSSLRKMFSRRGI